MKIYCGTLVYKTQKQDFYRMTCTFYWSFWGKWFVRICHWLSEYKGDLDQNRTIKTK